MRRNRRLPWTMIVPVLAVLTVLPACRQVERPEPIRRVIILDVDTLRGDYLGCAGGPVATPNLDALAARGVMFTRARSHVPITAPSHSSLFTGLLPSDHAVLNNGQVLGDGFETLAELAEENGFETAAFVSLGVLKDKYGLKQGFESYDQHFRVNSGARPAEDVDQAVFAWLDQGDGTDADARDLIWVHYSDPHGPYAAPGRPYASCTISVDGEAVGTAIADGWSRSFPVALRGGRATVTMAFAPDSVVRPPKLAVWDLKPAERSVEVVPGPGFDKTPWPRRFIVERLPASFDLVAADPEFDHTEVHFELMHSLSPEGNRREYGYEVRYVDHQIGRLLREMEQRGWLDDSLIVFTADHGEGLGDHGLGGHIHQLYDTLLHVPLIVVAPGHIPAGRVVDKPVSLVDVVPTIADLIGAPVPDAVRGRSLVPLLEGSEKPWPDRPHFAVTARPQADSDLEAVVFGGWKLIRKPASGEVALFDLRNDPGELTDLAADRPDRVAALARLLDEQHAEGPRTDTWADLDEESREQLEALGYLTGEQ